jgi:putative addiction module component (TIGR02574 family)
MAKPAIDISQLSPEERLDLIGELWDSLDDSSVVLSDQQRAELRRRMDRVRNPDVGKARPLRK